MKQTFWPRRLVAILFATALTLTTAAFAEDDNEQGGDIHGSEELHQTIILTATTNAPAGATGKAELEAENEDGVVAAILQIETQGLLAGTYTVSVTKESDASSVTLGTFDVSASAMDDNMGDDDQGDDNNQGDDEGDVEFGTDEGLPLPADLNPLDIASVSIADGDGHVVLTGDFMNVAATMKALFKAKVAVTGGVAAPGATGLAKVQSKIKRGFKIAHFNLNAKGMNPNATLTLKINGVDYGTVTTDKNGKLHMKTLPNGVAAESLFFMEFDDPDGTNALTISF